MHAIVVSNRKGGTGKTTVAVNIAAEFAARGLRVLIIDLDSQGHCAVGLGMKVGAGGTVVHRLFVDPAARLSDAIMETAVANLWLAPADPRFDHGTGSRNDQRLRAAIAAEGMAAGKPIRAYAPKSRGAEDFARLAEAVMQRLMDDE
jgi:chromosome partitioning protein